LPRIDAQVPLERVGLPLREHRTRVKVTLESIITQTKISRRFLEAIESGEYAQLPGGVFAVSYIRQYASLVGYDAELILEDYRRVVDGDGEVDSGTGRSQSEPRWVRFFEFG
jgi:cytoskeletal protein RodZ